MRPWDGLRGVADADHRQEARGVLVRAGDELDEGVRATGDRWPRAALDERGRNKQITQREGAHRQFQVLDEVLRRDAAGDLQAEMRDLAEERA